MTTQATRALVARFNPGILNERSADALGDVVAVDYVDHAAFPGQGPGPEGVKRRLETLWQALDPWWTIEEVIAEGDIVAVRWTLSGKHVGQFIGLPPTGRKVSFRGVDVYRVRDGKLAEHWNVVDLFGFYQQVTRDARENLRAETVQEPGEVRSMATTSRPSIRS